MGGREGAIGGHLSGGARTHRNFYLPRLPREFYQGDAVVHWTFPIHERRTGWLTHQFHARFRETLLHAAAREFVYCPTYCLMPDHMHLVWMGLRLESDQRNGVAYLRTHLADALAPCRFQHQPHDHVLKERERKRNAFAAVCRYILENPMRAGLVTQLNEWPFHGAILPGYPKMHPLEEAFWPRFWELYNRALAPSASRILRPPILG